MSNKLFEIQPASCRQPLERKEIIYSDFFKKEHSGKISVIERVLFFDPTPLYEKIGHLIDPNKRHQSIQMEQLFPKVIGECACGCGKKPESSKEGEERVWQRKWFNNDCQTFASDCLSIINNYFDVSKKYITHYYGFCCHECGVDKEKDKWLILDLDHIVPVKHGGGGCWLSNFKWKCKKCHVDKTNSDFKRKNYSRNNSNQTKLL